jgi:hypothetical protein
MESAQRARLQQQRQDIDLEINWRIDRRFFHDSCAVLCATRIPQGTSSSTTGRRDRQPGAHQYDGQP